jgi:NTP pyrophosphatase (non-canonical NTP hydrolase)
MDFKYIEDKVIEWAKDRMIFEQSSLYSQCQKLEEEFGELAAAIAAKNIDEIVDGLGDMMVVMTMISHMIEKDLFTCYAAAYLEIKDRKGKMINGLFVKE